VKVGSQRFFAQPDLFLRRLARRAGRDVLTARRDRIEGQIRLGRALRSDGEVARREREHSQESQHAGIIDPSAASTK